MWCVSKWTKDADRLEKLKVKPFFCIHENKDWCGANMTATAREKIQKHTGRNGNVKLMSADEGLNIQYKKGSVESNGVSLNEQVYGVMVH